MARVRANPRDEPTGVRVYQWIEEAKRSFWANVTLHLVVYLIGAAVVTSLVALNWMFLRGFEPAFRWNLYKVPSRTAQYSFVGLLFLLGVLFTYPIFFWMFGDQIKQQLRVVKLFGNRQKIERERKVAANDHRLPADHHRQGVAHRQNPIPVY